MNSVNLTMTVCIGATEYYDTDTGIRSYCKILSKDELYTIEHPTMSTVYATMSHEDLLAELENKEYHCTIGGVKQISEKRDNQFLVRFEYMPDRLNTIFDTINKANENLSNDSEDFSLEPCFELER